MGEGGRNDEAEREDGGGWREAGGSESIEGGGGSTRDILYQ